MTATAPNTPERLLEVHDLKVHFPIRIGFPKREVSRIRAVDGVSFHINAGETLGLVGESGCGKSTTTRALLRVTPPTDGRIDYRKPDGSHIDIAKASEDDMVPVYRDMRAVFQDPQASLNPRMRVIDIIGEVLLVNGLASGPALEARVGELLRKVGLPPEAMWRFPHAFSGGERQRISIARALAPNPRFVIADEAVSALDVSVRAQIINLLQDLQAELGLTYLFVSHDLSVVRHICNRVAVMYVGRIVEIADVEDIFAKPRHPYTEALLSAVPVADPTIKGRSRRIRLPGDVADPGNVPPGCAFHPRCRFATDRCKVETPALQPTATPGHQAACHYADSLDLRGAFDIQ
ncbi:peptide ABC transporter ATP-binding protein [Devosia riboflavina]|uniref:Peptide ABC transporter ATP-binding protein n=1 Tax=Devosia riboflavina TaxID=46914 RepID=A0A087LZH3_9HYPH|nr:oligopeptide/dipeptide ABC transporter ATP-binding protein [Devosia riboflavina]KFL30026.1 peptide ABC transporter ATP-binding protein [Devosia riboflavina]